jgi:hypothetical protein
MAMCTSRPDLYINILRIPGINSQPAAGPVTKTLLVTGGIDYSKSIPVLLKRIQIRVLALRVGSVNRHTVL